MLCVLELALPILAGQREELKMHYREKHEDEERWRGGQS